MKQSTYLVVLLLSSALGSDKAVKTLQAQLTAQTARIQTLEAQLRTGVCMTQPKSHAKQTKADRCSPLDVDPEPELAAFRAAERRRAAAKKQELLTTVFNVSVGKPLTAIAVSSGMLDNKGVPRLVAVADVSGALHLYDRTGELAVSLPASSETSAATISSIVIGPKEDPFVATGSMGGEVSLYNLSLPRIRTASTGPSGDPLPPLPPTTLKLAMRTPPQLDETGAPVPVLTMEAYLRARRTLLVVGDAAGSLRLLHRNGTQRSVVPVGGAVRVVERNKEGVFVAVAAEGRGVLLYDMGKPSPTPMQCESSSAAEDGAVVSVSPGASIVSLGWDVQLPQLLYAGTDGGDLLVFNSKARTRKANKAGNETRLSSICKLVTVLSGHTPVDVQLAPLKGYVFSAAEQLLAVHNVSGLYARTRDEPTVMLGRALPPPPTSAAAGTAGWPLLAGTREKHVAVGAGATGQLVLLASKLVFREEAKEGAAFGLGGFGDSSASGPAWLMRNPLVLGVIMMLVFWQSQKFYGKDKGGGPGGPGSPGGPGGLGGLDPDFLRTLESMRATGDFGNGRGGGRGGNGGGGSRIEEIDH